MSIDDNPVTTRTLAIFKDRNAGSLTPEDSLKRSKIALFVGVQWVFFAMSFAISNTIGESELSFAQCMRASDADSPCYVQLPLVSPSSSLR